MDRACVLAPRQYRGFPGGESPPDALYDRSRSLAIGTHHNVSWVQLPTGHWVRYFNGVDSYVISTTPALLNAGYARGTIIIWANTETWNENYGCLFNLNDGSGGNWTDNRVDVPRNHINPRYLLSLADNIDYMGPDGPQTPDLNLNRWYCIGFDWDGTNARCYLNGALVDMEAQTITDPNANGGISRMVWGMTVPPGTQRFRGWMGEVLLYTAPLYLDLESRYFESTRRLYGV